MVSHLYNISFIFLTSLFMVDFIVYIRVIRVIRSLDHPLFSFVIMSFCLQKNHLSPFFIMSFCFKKIICLHFSLCHSVFKKIIYLHLSLCYSVSKKSSVFIRLYVILSSKNHLSPFVIMLFCLKNILCLRPSPCYSVSHIFCLSDVEMSLQRGV